MTVMKSLAAAAALAVAGIASAQTLPTNGALVVVPAFGEVKHANDQAVAILAIEEQDKDKAAA
ncbi:MAG: SIMPL domain-containing protein, partial [Burkholderiaceae bacterium]|nr:SIMPL domain-containing protein [Burkholderiaceae bacterium]